VSVRQARLRPTASVRTSRRATGSWPVPRLLFGTVVFALASATGCDSVGPEVETDLDRARATWQSAAIRDYTYVVQRGCFCAPDALGPVRVTVEDGVVTEAVYLDSGRPVGAFGNLFPAVEGLFDLIRDAVADKAYRVDVAYDAELGFPTVIDIDYIENAVDDELMVWARDFLPSS
jgi:hypothetical protein